MTKSLFSKMALSALVSVGLALATPTIAHATTPGYFSKAPHKRFTMPAEAIANNDFIAKKVNFKINEKYRNYCSEKGIEIPQLKNFFQLLGVTEFKKAFVNSYKPEVPYNQYGQKLVDLSLIFEIKYSANVSVEDAINYIYQQGEFVDFAEPHYLYHTFYTPNDPSIGNQGYLSKIQAYTGWDITKGSSNMIIGIVDSGIDLSHPEFPQGTKLVTNPNDPIDNVDNDNDGYIDNNLGWDTGENDRDIQYKSGLAAQAGEHGTHVAGIAAASTDNSTGIAGVAFNCKLLIVKAAEDVNGKIAGGYSGIYYAADHGAKVINCSFGGSYYSELIQTVIDYAFINKDVVIVAASGNGSKEEDNYPASYERVVSVANLNSNDSRNSTSSISGNVDVSAPGTGIYSSWPVGSYSSQTGTSMASPVACGVAAMIRVQFPNYNAYQTVQQLKNTCDDIYTTANPNKNVLWGKLGKGRVNMYKALNNPTTPGIEITKRNITDGNDNAFVAGDTLQIRCDFTNFLNASSANTNVKLSSKSNYVTVVPGSNTATLGAIANLATVSNTNAPFKFKINSSAPANSTVLFKAVIKDGSYSDTSYFNVIVNVDYLNIGVNDVTVSVPSNGRIGYVGSNQTGGGLGFMYKGANLMYESGLMVGTDPTHVSDLNRGLVPYYNDTDFVKVTAIKQQIPATASAAWESYGNFNDNGTLNKLDVSIDHREYAWTSTNDRKYVILQYKITNNSANAYPNLYAGILTDWDIKTFTKNRGDVDATSKMGYAYFDTTVAVQKVFAGVKLLSHDGFTHYALDNDSTSGGVSSGDFGYSQAEKYTMLSTNRAQSGVAGAGNDVLDAVSTGPISLGAGQSATVAFAMLAGDNLADIQASAAAAQIKYDLLTGITENTAFAGGSLIQNYPNPASGTTTIELQLKKAMNIELSLVDMTGREVATIAKGSYGIGKNIFTFDVSNLSNGVYYYQVRSADGVATQKMMIAK